MEKFDLIEIKKMYKNAIIKKLNKAQTSYNSAKKDTIEAEGRMVTRYDSTKTETAWLADGYQQEVLSLTSLLEHIEKKSLFVNWGDTISGKLFKNTEFLRNETFSLASSETLNQYYSILGHCETELIQLDTAKSDTYTFQIDKITKVTLSPFITLESIVIVQDEDNYTDYFYLTNTIGGFELTYNNIDIFCSSPFTPLTKALLGKKIGDLVTLNTGFTYKIIDVQN